MHCCKPLHALLQPHILPCKIKCTAAKNYTRCCNHTCSLAKLNAPLQTPTCSVAAPHVPLHPHMHHCNPPWAPLQRHTRHCNPPSALLQVCMPPCNLTRTCANPRMQHCSPTCPLVSPQAPLQLHVPPCRPPALLQAHAALQPCTALRPHITQHHNPTGTTAAPHTVPQGPAPRLHGHHPANSPHPVPGPLSWALAWAELSFNDGQAANATRGHMAWSQASISGHSRHRFPQHQPERYSH